MASLMIRAFATETGAELLKVLRMPQFMLPTLALPVAFYLLFAVLVGRGAAAPAYLLATYGVFAVMGPSLFGFGAGVASEREQGWLSLKRTAPTPAYGFIGAKLCATLLVSAMALVPIYLAGGFLGDVALARPAWALLLAIHLLAVLPFALLGLAIGFTFGSNAAVAVANLAFLGLAVIGGLWFPASLFPGWLAQLAALLPSYHLAETALWVVAPQSHGDPARHVGATGVMTVLLALVAGFAWVRRR